MSLLFVKAANIKGVTKNMRGMSLFNFKTIKRSRTVGVQLTLTGFLASGLLGTPKVHADLSPFFNYQNNAVMVGYATGLHRQLLSLFLQQTFVGTRFNTLYSASYLMPGTVWGFPLRHRFEIAYNGNTKGAYDDYTCWMAGWLPEALVSLYPVYVAFGFGPYIRSRSTPVSGGQFTVAANLAIGITLDPVNIECFFRHHSNFYTASPNHGADFFGIALSYPFDIRPS